jgi:hypothetical protein
MRALTLAAILLLPGCVTAGLPSCPGNARAQLRAELIFGRGLKSGGEGGEAAWRRFLDREVTPRFPDGFTVIDASGQWRSPGAVKLVKERSKVLVVAMPDDPDRRARLDEIAAAYKRAFNQDSVVSIIALGCVSF